MAPRAVVLGFAPEQLRLHHLAFGSQNEKAPCASLHGEEGMEVRVESGQYWNGNLLLS